MVPVLQAHPVDVPVIVGHAATGEHAAKSVQNDSLLLFNCFCAMEHLKGLFINYVTPLGGGGGRSPLHFARAYKL